MTDASAIVARLVREDIRAAAAYHVQDARGLLKLDAMESPWGWPAELRETLASRLLAASPNRYPDPRADTLRALLHEAFAIPRSRELLLGNGSDELIMLLMLALAGPGMRVMAPGPTFVMFRVIAGWLGIPYDEVPLGADFALDAGAMRRAMREARPRLLFLACPNNPSGNLFDAGALESVVEASRETLVVIDEAYWAFSARDHLGWLERHPNLLVMRTLSKLGLAGLRLGFLVGDPAWIRELDKVRLPYNVGVLNQVACEVALENFGLLQDRSRLLVEERGHLAARLAGDPGMHVWPSEANFLLVRPDVPARALHAAMARRGVLVKCLDGAHPALAGCLRLTVGAPEENRAMCEALDASLAELRR